MQRFVVSLEYSSPAASSSVALPRYASVYGHVIAVVGERHEMDVELGQEGCTQLTVCRSKVVFALTACNVGRAASERGGRIDTFGCRYTLAHQQENSCSRSGGGSGSEQLW